MKAYRLDRRERIVQAVERGMSQLEAAALFRVGERTVKRSLHQWRTTGALVPAPADAPPSGPTSTPPCSPRWPPPPTRPWRSIARGGTSRPEGCQPERVVPPGTAARVDA